MVLRGERAEVVRVGDTIICKSSEAWSTDGTAVMARRVRIRSTGMCQYEGV